MTQPDFWVPYRFGHLPMKIVSQTISEFVWDELLEIQMTIEAVSCGAPVFGRHVEPREIGS